MGVGRQGLQLVVLVTPNDVIASTADRELPEHGYGVMRVHDLRGAIEQLRSARPDVFIVDADGDTEVAVRVCEQLSLDPRIEPTTPMLVVSQNPLSPRDRVRLLEAGAWDCLRLPDESGEMFLKLGHLTQAKREADFNRATSLLDATSDMYNVRGLMRRAQEAGAVADRYHSALACVTFAPVGIDPDDPSDDAVEQSFEILQATLKRLARVSDIVGLLGDRELAVVALGTGPVPALQMTQRILREVDARLEDEGLTQQAAICAGYWAVSDFHGAGVRPPEMLARALTALRDLQRHGRAGERIRIFTPDLQNSRPDFQSIRGEGLPH